MNLKKLSINHASLLFGIAFVLISAAMAGSLYILTHNFTAVICCLLFCILLFSSTVCFLFAIRHKLTLFSDFFCKTLDDMLSGNAEPDLASEEESLFYKINFRLIRLYEVMQKKRSSIAREHADLQELISDISHQVKTPIANLKIINATLLEQHTSLEKQHEFLIASTSQLDKLDFLMQAMIKTSRLETGVISLDQKYQSFYDTLATALGGILLTAEQKQLQVTVDCPEHLMASHDRKWTSEALFNILDNAVKYTPVGGSIHVTAEQWELYLKVSILDTGRGIEESHHGTIFKRFYREDTVHDIEGIGIGLYLARKIITLQGGYIKVTSELNRGSNFSIFLPCK